MRVAPTVTLTELDREWLLKVSGSGVTSQRLGDRCRIVLLAAEGLRNDEIEAALNIPRKKVGRWRTRFLQLGREGIEKDAPGRGRKPTYPEDVRQLVVEMTTRGRPPNATHWSLATMAKAVDLAKPANRRPHLAGTRTQAAFDPDFQGVQRSSICGETRRRHRALSQRARTCRGPLCR